MFTGLIQEIGTLKRLRRTSSGLRWTITAPVLAPGIKAGDSVNVSGACQTVESVDGDMISGTAIPTTLRLTTFAHWRVGQRVNLEPALRADDRLGGHIVSGHVDTTGRVTRVTQSREGFQIDVAFAPEFDRWLVPQGSISVDGVSLTVAGKRRGTLTVAIIPETLARSTLGERRVGERVNLEFDQMIKAAVAGVQGGIDAATLAEAGY
ncbi:MAG TPA: riboflavin synthase [Acidobacteriota bacterium]|nr:riboflavin synthase [Acidobacteriota bacterium]